MQKYTAALVGLGRIGYSLGLDKKREQPASHTMALLNNPRINLIAGCDTDSIALSKWQDANKKAVGYSDSANLYARCRPDIVTVAVNENAHLKEAVEAIHAKPKLVILEKPVALNLSEAEKIQQAAKEFQVPVLVNHERRFAEDFKLAKSYMKKIGEIQSIRAELCSSLCVYNPAEEKTGAYSLIHDGTHLVDAVLFFLEDDLPSTLKKISLENPSEKKGGLLSRASGLNNSEKKIKTVNSLLRFPIVTGVFRDEEKNVRQFSAHYSTPKCPDVTIGISGRSRFFGFEISITGTEGRVCIGNGYLKLYHREKSSLYSGFYSLLNDRSESLPKKTFYFSNMIQNAVDFLDGKANLRSTLQTGINALSVLEEIKEIIK
ncbi:Gfo/Idh/MocA family oxidoreductase [uncultured Treponema sp.]|uniref:Gfo/Idh/MocA family protein n=1 Tax=uncultured Treponema sp. TaxID=162155 RepID=UPI000E8FD72A|nr:Gfo/Idh/MocA family oxidoreductase [uncultured Treponema sp.]HAZ96280.1 gfo/Idh/MocA family oxidoreductase [Treponema sp.]